MMFPMTRQTKNLKVFKNIVSSIFIYIMNFKFATFFKTSFASMLKIIQSNFSVACDPVNISRIIFSFWFVNRKMTKSSSFGRSTSCRTMNSIKFAWSNFKNVKTFGTSFFRFFSSIIFMETIFTAKNVTAITTRYFEKITALFAAFRFSGFGKSKRITCFRAINLSLIISRNFLITLFAIHANNNIRNTLTSQPLLGD